VGAGCLSRRRVTGSFWTVADTALHAHLAAHGAVLADDRGIVAPERFGDVAAEYAALRTGAAVLDLGFRSVVRATGPDAATFLQGMLTNDVMGLTAGQGCRALQLTIQGRVLADVRVAVTDAGLALDVDARVRDAFIAALERLIIADDVELAHDERAVLAVEGPRAAALVEVQDLPPFAHRETSIGGVAVRVARGAELGADGVTVYVSAQDAARVWDAVVALGARPCGMAALEGRRIELGVPRVGLDMDETMLALEVPVDEAISFTKGCYLGQEVIARGTARGHVNRKLVGFVLEGPPVPRGASLARDGKEVGHLTSVGYAFGLAKPAAMGMVRRECWDPGTELAVRHGHAVTIARVTSWPLA